MRLKTYKNMLRKLSVEWECVSRVGFPPFLPFIVHFNVSFAHIGPSSVVIWLHLPALF
jgi:hypothetical protein